MPPKKKSETESISYEEARTELTEIVRTLEGGLVNLDDAVKLWERGEELAKICQDWLEGAREKITSLVNDETSN